MGILFGTISLLNLALPYSLTQEHLSNPNIYSGIKDLKQTADVRVAIVWILIDKTQFIFYTLQIHDP